MSEVHELSPSFLPTPQIKFKGLVFSLFILIFNIFQHPTIVHGISSWTIHKKRSNRCSWQTLSYFERCWGGYSLHFILPVHILQCHSGLGNALPHVIISIPSPLVTLQQWVRKIDNFKQFSALKRCFNDNIHFTLGGIPNSASTVIRVKQ